MCANFKWLHLLCFAVKVTQVPVSASFSSSPFLCWMPKNIYNGVLQDRLFITLISLQASVVEVRRSCWYESMNGVSSLNTCINIFFALVSVALWWVSESDPSVWCTRELVLYSNAVCGVIHPVGLSFHSLVCTEKNGEMLSSLARNMLHNITHYLTYFRPLTLTLTVHFM